MIGEVYNSKSYGKFKVVEYVDMYNVTIQFLDTNYSCVVGTTDIKRGSVKDYCKPTLFGVGVVGKNLTNGKLDYPEIYDIWSRLLCRCYYSNTHIQQPTYADCTTSENFKHLVFFESWCLNQVGFGSTDDKCKPFALDKDILVKGNKIYSEETCCFVPREINSLLILSNARRGKYPIGVSYNRKFGKFIAEHRVNCESKYLGCFDTPEEAFYAYKESKEAHIKDVANKWKDRIDPRVYKALISWNVEITD